MSLDADKTAELSNGDNSADQPTATDMPVEKPKSPTADPMKTDVY
jgi:hypothetical protein